MTQPLTVNELLADDEKLRRFLAWQPGLTNVVMFCQQGLSGYLTDSTSAAELATRFGSDGQYPIDWDALGMKHMILFAVDFDSGGNLSEHAHSKGLATRTFREIDAELRRVLQSYVDSFVFSEEVSQPKAEEVKLADIDAATVKSINEAVLKDLPADQSLPYWQNGPYLILGGMQSAAWRMAIERANGLNPDGDQGNGLVTMVSRGGALSSGKISVNGKYERDAFKSAIREFSNKDIDFI
jgi:hypothetical protein